MVTRKFYEQTTEEQWKKLRVATLTELRSGMMRIPADTICSVIHKRSGLTLEAPKCPHCGVSLFIIGVEPGKIRVIDEK